ncbi:MAG: hypothetical protein IKR73_10025 [Oscillospiraceae bacterium]|nr:hypothetical protein [Oscillospiraceae bacterium]
MNVIDRMVLSVAAAMLLGGVMTHRDALRCDIPDWAVMEDMHTSRTMDGETVTVDLHEGILSISSPDMSYTSDDEQFVAGCIFADIDHDGSDDVMLHVWKKGSYGDHHPFWEDDDKTLFSEHLFIYHWDRTRESRLRAIWMSSSMPVTGEDVSVGDDGVVTIMSTDGSISRWCWEHWGLVRIG